MQPPNSGTVRETGTHRLRSRQRGFTLLEFLTVMLVLALVIGTGVPPLLQQIHRARVVGYANEVSRLLQIGRYEAIRNRVNVIVRLDLDERSAIAFGDVHGEALTDPPDGIFNPIDGQMHRDTDWEIGRAVLPGQLSYIAPASELVIEGFTTIDGEQVAQYQFDGSVSDPGSFRFADDFENYLEIRINPAATGKVTIRKYNEELAQWLENDEEGLRWEWYK